MAATLYNRGYSAFPPTLTLPGNLSVTGTLTVTDAVTFSSTLAVSGVLTIPAGSASAPGLAISGDTNTGLYSPGTDQIALATAGTLRMSIDSIGSVAFTQAAGSSGSPVGLTWTGGAHTSLAASTEATDFLLDLARTVQFAAGALTTQRAVQIEAPTYSFDGASTLTNPITLDIFSAPGRGTNATFTSPRALRVGATNVTLGATSAGFNYATIAVPAHTITVTGSTGVTATVGAAALSLGIITVSDVAAMTMDAAATLYIAGAPAGGGAGPTAITNAYALWVDNGATRLDGNLGFFGTAPVAQQTGPTLNITNNVTSGGTDGTIANFTDLSTYANDALTIRRDIYQLARAIKFASDALRAYGLIT